MSHPGTALDQVQLRDTLIAFLNQTMPACASLDYRLVGSAAALLHGVTLPAGDIDILVRDRATLDTFDAAMTAFRRLQAPTWLADSRQYYSAYEVRGVQLEISTVEVASDTDTIETFGRGPWEHFTWLACGPYQVPTVALELRLITELLRNRPDRYHPLIHFMQRHGCDLDLLQRGLVVAGLPDTLRDEVYQRFSPQT